MDPRLQQAQVHLLTMLESWISLQRQNSAENQESQQFSPTDLNEMFLTLNNMIGPVSAITNLYLFIGLIPANQQQFRNLVDTITISEISPSAAAEVLSGSTEV